MTPDVILNSKYISTEFKIHNSFIKSMPGTGKTHNICENIKRLLKTKPDLRVLFISTRISFSNTMKCDIMKKHNI
jgi:type I site-specific restriction endonuclease